MAQTTLTVGPSTLRDLDTSYVEAVGSPGAGKYLDIVRIKETVTGDDAIATPSGSVQEKLADRYGYGLFFAPATGDKPFLRSEIDLAVEWYLGLQPEEGEASGPYTAEVLIGSEQIAVDKPLMFGAFLYSSAASKSSDYSASAWDALMAPLQDRTMTLEIEWYAREPADDPVQPPHDTGNLVISVNAWCTVDDVRRLTGDAVFDATTSPSLADVEAHVKSAWGLINGRLRRLGVTPVATDPVQLSYLAAANARFSASQVLMARNDIEASKELHRQADQALENLAPSSDETSLTLQPAGAAADPSGYFGDES